MSETDATRDKDQFPPAPTPEPSTKSGPAPNVQEPADAQRFVEQPAEGESEKQD